MKTHKRKFLRILLAALGLGASSMASAIPVLQLDFEEGEYVGGTDETTYCYTTTCEIYALLTPKNENSVEELLADKYYLSIALVPKTGPDGTDLGSFDIDGKTVDVTGDMTYGTPPLEDAVATTDPNDLSSHGIFETYFYEIAFQFSDGNTITPYNVQDDAEVDPSDKIVDGDGGYYETFTIDITELDPSVALHFDLYNSIVYDVGNNIDSNEVIGVDDFAPFSKDAQMSADTEPFVIIIDVAEPSVVALLGLGMLGLGGVVVRTRLRKKSA